MEKLPMAEINLGVQSKMDISHQINNIGAEPVILYHDNCADGFCSAWIAHQKFGDKAQFIPVQYGQDPPDVTGKDVYILDFSYKAPVLMKMIEQAVHITIRDHHKTAQAELAQFQNSDKLDILFDMNKSGGRLTWDFFKGNENPNWLVFYTQDRDLWQWLLPNSKEVNDAIQSYPYDFHIWNSLSEYKFGTAEFDMLIREGQAINRYKQQIINNAVANASPINMAGHEVLTVNAMILQSEIAGELAKDRPFGTCYYIRKDGKKQWSLRSRDGGIDVSEIAKARGGGGHRNAAGFEE
jgi:uncharacterized protein